MKQIANKNFWVNVVMASLYFIIGLLCVIIPKPLTTAIPYILGAALIINGGLRIAGYFLHKKGLAFGLTIYGLAEGILDILLAVIIFINASISLIIVAVLIGVWALISGIINLTKAINNLEGNKQPIINYIFATVQIVLGVLMFFNYSGGITVSVIIAGIYLMFLALNIVLTKIVTSNNFSELKQSAEKAISPATTRLALEPSVPNVLNEQPTKTNVNAAETQKHNNTKPTNTNKPKNNASQTQTKSKVQSNTKNPSNIKNKQSYKQSASKQNQTKKTTN